MSEISDVIIMIISWVIMLLSVHAPYWIPNDYYGIGPFFYMHILTPLVIYLNLFNGYAQINNLFLIVICLLNLIIASIMLLFKKQKEMIMKIGVDQKVTQKITLIYILLFAIFLFLASGFFNPWFVDRISNNQEN